MRVFLKTFLHQDDVVQGRDDGEEKCGAQEFHTRDAYPKWRIHLTEKDEKYGADLRKRIRLAEDARTKVPQTGDREEHCAGCENRDVTAEYHDGVFPGNLVQDREHEKHCAEQQLVCNRVKILPEQRLLMERTGQQSVQAIIEFSYDENNQRPEIFSVDKVNHNERNEDHPQECELIGRCEDLRELHTGSLEACGGRWEELGERTAVGSSPVLLKKR